MSRACGTGRELCVCAPWQEAGQGPHCPGRRPQPGLRRAGLRGADSHPADQVGRLRGGACRHEGVKPASPEPAKPSNLGHVGRQRPVALQGQGGGWAGALTHLALPWPRPRLWTPAGHLTWRRNRQGRVPGPTRSPQWPEPSPHSGPTSKGSQAAPGGKGSGAGSSLTGLPPPAVVRHHVHTTDEVRPELLQVLRLGKLPGHAGDHHLLHAAPCRGQTQLGSARAAHPPRGSENGSSESP